MCNDRISFISRKKPSVGARITVKPGNEPLATVTHHGRPNTPRPPKRECEISSGDHTISGRKRGNLYIVEARCNTSAYASELQPESELQAELPPRQQMGVKAQSEGKKRVKRKRSIVAIRPGHKTVSESRLWHRRLAHLHPATMRSLDN